MIRVKLSTNSPDWPFIRQTPGQAGLWGECRFFINEDVDECDFWVVYDDVLRPETTRCPPGNTLLITGEPPSVKTYSPRFLNQFARVLTCHRGMKHPNVIHSQQALPWHLLNKTYDELAFLPAPQKTKNLSVISSDKAFTEGHRLRLEFVQRLKQDMGDGLDYFGKGVRVPKWDGTAAYKYSIVIENSCYADYWTEKLADAFLVETYPFYYGCPNVSDYFSKNAYTAIDIRDYDSAREAIVEAMKHNLYEETVDARRYAKEQILNQYNLFPVIEKFTLAGNYALPPAPLCIQPDNSFPATLLSKIKDKARGWINLE